MHTLAILGLAAIGWPVGLVVMIAAVSLFAAGAAALALPVALLLRTLGWPVTVEWHWIKKQEDTQ